MIGRSTLCVLLSLCAVAASAQSWTERQARDEVLLDVRRVCTPSASRRTFAGAFNEQLMRRAGVAHVETLHGLQLWVRCPRPPVETGDEVIDVVLQNVTASGTEIYHQQSLSYQVGTEVESATRIVDELSGHLKAGWARSRDSR